MSLSLNICYWDLSRFLSHYLFANPFQRDRKTYEQPDLSLTFELPIERVFLIPHTKSHSRHRDRRDIFPKEPRFPLEKAYRPRLHPSESSNQVERLV